jgi:hypothetical protein
VKIIARLILIIGVLVWLGPAVIGFFALLLVFWLLAALAGWDDQPHR